MIRFYLIIIAFLLLLPFCVFADVIINEICWMGTEASYNDEWIELYNSSDSDLSLGGWILKAEDGTPEITLSGTISAKGFYLLERTDDTAVPNIAANQIYTGALGNQGEYLQLFDNFGNLIDLVDCSDSWVGGDNETKQTMERTAQNTWQTSDSPGGTPGVKNSFVFQEPIPEPAPSPEPEFEPTKSSALEPEPQTKIISLEKTELKTYPSGIIINEILPSPEGPDNEEEWLELKNLNNQTIDISNWEIQDTIGSTKTYTFPKNTKILGRGFLLLERPVSKITLNNSGDGLKLFYPNDNLVDEVVFGKAPLGQSCNRANSQWFWSSNLTPGSENIIGDFQPKESPSPAAPTGAAGEGLSDTGSRTSEMQKQLAAVSSQLSKPRLTILIAALLALFSALIILILKKKLKIIYNKNI